MSLHHQIAVEGVGFGHKILSVLGFGKLTVEVHTASGASVYNQALKKILKKQKEKDEIPKLVLVIKYEGKVISSFPIKIRIANFVIKVTPKLNSIVSFGIKLLSKIPTFKVFK